MRKFTCIVAYCLALTSYDVFAFDPLTAAAVVQTAAEVVSTLSDTTSELGSAADAFGDLYSELDSEANVSSGGRRTIEKMKEVESLAREVGYTKQEIVDLLDTDQRELQNVTLTLKRITAAVRTGKRIARLISKLEKKAQMSQLESTAIEREQLQVQYKLLNEQIEERLNKKKEVLQKDLERKKQIQSLNDEIKKRGAKGFGKTGVYTFPKIDLVTDKAIKLAKDMRPVFLGLTLLMFLVRVIYYQFGIFGISNYGKLFRDVSILFILMAVFPELIHATLGISTSVSEKIAFGHVTELQNPSNFPGMISLASFSRSASLLIVWICSWLKYVAFVLADFLFNFGIAFLIILFPLVIFVSQMLSFSIAWVAFFACFLSLCLWPFFWNATGFLATELWSINNPTLSDSLKTLCFSLLQLISPLVGMLALKGHSIGGAIEGTMLNVSNRASMILRTGQGAVLNPLHQKVARGAVRTVGWGVNQSIYRSSAAFHRGKEASVASAMGSSSKLKRASSIAWQGTKGFIFNEPKMPNERTAFKSVRAFGNGLRSARPVLQQEGVYDSRYKKT